MNLSIFPHSIPFPEVKLKDFLNQATSNIANLLTQPPSTAITSLKSGDLGRNAILTLAQLLKLADEFTALISSKVSMNASLLRVQNMPLPRVKNVSLQRVTDRITQTRADIDGQHSAIRKPTSHQMIMRMIMITMELIHN